MKITIKLFATFRDGRFKEEQREIPEGITLRQVVADVGIVEREIGMTLINGCHAPLDKVLSDGDNIFLFPMLTGG
jgi:molybdopterin converting factor small subunit